MEIADKLEDIEFVDDVCLLTEKRNYMQGKLQKLEVEARKTGLKINVKKTKISRNRNEQISQIKRGNVDIESPKNELFRSSNRKEWKKQGRCTNYKVLKRGKLTKSH
jgi:hypothetical protein